jgi:hypothetical protein
MWATFIIFKNLPEENKHPMVKVRPIWALNENKTCSLAMPQEFAEVRNVERQNVEVKLVDNKMKTSVMSLPT